jgi:bifunctional DNA-binding transcriptional regulator/antitoxin component of YhaV-PrlF toxin-antitoxin module
MTIKMIPIKDGSITIPDDLRERSGIEDGSLLLIEAGAEGIMLRPAGWREPEIYTPERIAEFLLNNAVDVEDYQGAVKDVEALGIDPATVPHDRPSS